MTILKFETKKFFSNPKNPLLIFVGLLLIIFVSYSEQNNLKEERKELLAADQFSILYLQSDITMADPNDTILMNNFNQALDALQKKLTYVQKKEWRKALEQENLFLEASKKISSTYPASYLQQYDSNKLSMNKYYLKQNLKPENGLYGVSANYYVRKIATLLFSIYGFIFCVLLFYDLFSSEKEKNHGPFLKTLPIKYKSFLLTKIGLAFLLICILFGLSFVVSFVTGYFLSGEIGKVMYPMFITDVQGQFLQLSFPEYILQGMIPFFLINYIILIGLIFLQNSRIQSEKLLVLFLTLLGLYSTFIQMLSFDNYYLSLLNYINIHQEIEWLFMHHDLTTTQFTLLIGTLIIISGSVILFTKKEKAIELQT